MIATLRRRLAPGIKTAALHLGLYSILRRLAPSRGVAILRYHAICGPEGHAYASPAICLPPTDFERHVAYITRRYRVLPLPEVAEAMASGRSLPANAVVFTFDDGYADNLEAARTLARHGATGTFYITAGCMQGGETFWVSEVRYLVARLQPDGGVLRSRGQNIPLAAGPGAAESLATVTRLLKSVTIPEREDLRRQFRDIVGAPPMPSPMLTWNQVRQMQAMGMTIGSHTTTHANLPSAGLDDAAREMRESKARLEDETGQRVTMFSYPNGGAERYFTNELMGLASAVGYRCATTSEDGLASPTSNLFALERVPVNDLLHELVFRLEVERFAFRPTTRRRGR